MTELRDLVTNPDLIYVDYAQPGTKSLVYPFEVAAIRWQTDEDEEAGCDYAWIREGKLYGVEEKRSEDLETSVRKRRLQRQLREMLPVVDVPILGLRMEETFSSWEYALRDKDVAKMQTLRYLSEWPGRTLWLPDDPAELMEMLLWARTGLTAPTLGILAGTDRKKVTKAPTPYQLRLRRLFSGVGPKRAKVLEVGLRAAGLSFAAAISAKPSVWKEAGAQIDVLRQLREMQKK